MRKRSVDSRGETDASRSNENVGLLSSSPANPKREQQSVSAASTPTFNKAKLLFGSKPENTNLGSVLALNSSVSKLNTISETEKIKAPSKKLPILPPLNEAVSVKQKWVILLSKAKGGVHMIPRTFVINENDANIFRQKTQEQIIEYTSKINDLEKKVDIMTKSMMSSSCLSSLPNNLNTSLDNESNVSSTTMGEDDVNSQGGLGGMSDNYWSEHEYRLALWAFKRWKYHQMTSFRVTFSLFFPFRVRELLVFSFLRKKILSFLNKLTNSSLIFKFLSTKNVSFHFWYVNA